MALNGIPEPGDLVSVPLSKVSPMRAETPTLCVVLEVNCYMGKLVKAKVSQDSHVEGGHWVEAQYLSPAPVEV